MVKWPKDNQAALLAFYGTPGPDVERQLVQVVPPFQMYYDGKPIKSIRFHRKAAPALAAALKEIWDHYGHDQKKIDALGISRYAGAYNPRYVRGSTTKWSNHAYGAAIDLNAQDNGFGKGHGNIPQPVIDAFKRQGARWGGDYHGRTDPMHFEFCDASDYPGQMAKPTAFVEPPQTDGDTDAHVDNQPAQRDPVPEVEPAPVDQIEPGKETPLTPEKKEGFFDWVRRKRKTVTSWIGGGVGGGSLLTYFTDWKVLAVIVGGLIVGGTIAYIFWLLAQKR